jgi:Domain of unknown function (DUF4440)
MPSTPARRKDYMQRTGVTNAQLTQTVGKITLQRENVRASSTNNREAARALSGIKTFLLDLALISAMRNHVTQESKKGTLTATEKADLDADEKLLNEMFADEFILTNPKGVVVKKAGVIENILEGKIRYSAFGKGGFETTENVIQIHKDHAVLSGMFKMDATQLARHRKSGEIKRVPRGGTFRSISSYVYRDDRWQLTAMQLVRVPDTQRDWVYIDD